MNADADAAANTLGLDAQFCRRRSVPADGRQSGPTTSLAEELDGNGTNGNGRNGSNSHADTSAEHRPVRPATQSQVKAIHGLAKANGVNVGQVLRERFHVNRPEELTIREASQLIDSLKNPNGKGG